ncbi:CDP-diacylglycerol--serine O-phosphatidyltransferase [Peribacillus kribbensis]|uniref:CDP-diacylglycerol--serine O-phosphatidyltransferase n=1 Tax=Peribacillus kribbensis TaxID=356658 RepID=UPI000412F5EE|nr:CDP-diacylglycerol--serine O-phosphatidyltransferase [Peribacillus kribbensis]
MIFQEVLDQTIKKLKSQAANGVTMINVCLGGYSIIAAMNNSLHTSVLCIFLAALADCLDGKVARKFNCGSEFGRQLDSLGDILSFGAAPALVIYQGVAADFEAPAAFFFIFYIVCGVFRLARFNINKNSDYFTGLPITAAGCLLALSYLTAPGMPGMYFLFLMIVLSLFMVSPIKLKKM